MSSGVRSPGSCTLVFDLGRVLVDFDHDLIVRRVISLMSQDGSRQDIRISPEELYRMVFHTPILQDFERGKVSPEAFYGELKEKFNLNVSYERFVEIWSDIFSEKADSLKVVDRLKAQGYPLFILSNIDCLHHAFVRDHFSVLDRFDRHFLSYEMGVAKPDPEIYQAVIKASGHPASDIFYVDDRQDLIDAGRRCGLHAVVFTGADQLEKDLAVFGVNGVSAS